MVLTTTLLTETRSDIKDALELLFLHSAIGTGTTTPTAGDTTLETEVFRSAVDAFSKAVANKVTASLRVGLSEANGNAITENGWLDADPAGNLWTHNLMTAVNKTADIQLFLDTTITIAVTEA